MRTPRFAAALSLAGAISLASLPVQAAPLTALSAAAKPAAQDSNAIQVRWGGWHGGWGFGIGALAAGALIGAAIASPYYGPYPYYSYGYGYPYGYSYGYPYGYSYGYTTTYYPAYSYSYYRPRRHYYAGYRPYWRNSYGMVRVHHHYRHYHHR